MFKYQILYWRIGLSTKNYFGVIGSFPACGTSFETVERTSQQHADMPPSTPPQRNR